MTARSARAHFWSIDSRSDEPELMDGADLDPAELAVNFRDIQRVNRLLGGTAVVLRHLPRVIESVPQDAAVTVLDLATGSADIPAAIVRWARQHGRPISVVASDNNGAMLEIASRRVTGSGEITLASHDARDVDLPDASFDVVLCSLSLHHFAPDEAVRVLREMNRLAKRGFIVNDLRRCRTGYVAAWFAARLTTRNRLTRSDAPLSVLRAYTPDELASLLRRAGVEGATISSHSWFRMAAVNVKADADD